MTLNEQVKKYAELKKQQDAIKEEMDSLKTSIVEEMGDATSFEADNGVVAKLVAKETFKYKDEIGMINYLKEHGMSSFVVEKIDTKSMNKELKKGMSLTESLSPMFTKETTVSLTVE